MRASKHVDTMVAINTYISLSMCKPALLDSKGCGVLQGPKKDHMWSQHVDRIPDLWPRRKTLSAADPGQPNG